MVVLNVSTSQPNVTLDEGATETLHCELTYSEAIDVWAFWLFNGEMIDTKLYHSGDDQVLDKTVTNTSTLQLKYVTQAQSGTYTCGAYANSTGILISTMNISVMVKDAEGPSLVPEQSVVDVEKGKNATLSCVAAYPAALYIDSFWTFNGSRIHRSKTNSKYEENRFKLSEGIIKRRRLDLEIYNVGFEDIGHYTCVLNTSHGLREKNISVHVNMGPTLHSGRWS